MAQMGHEPATLTSLPTETLLTAFDLARADYEFGGRGVPKQVPIILKPICKSLLPVTRALLYRRVQLGSLDQVVSFAKTVTSNSAIATQVEGLMIRVPWKSHGTIIDPEKVEQDPPAGLSSDLVRRMLEALVNLEQLIVVGSSVIAEAALSSKGAEKRFQRLTHLTFHSSFIHLSEPFSPRLFSCTSHFPKLESITLDWEWDIEKDDPRGGEDFDTPSSCPQVEALSLRGPLAMSPSLEAVLGMFPSLTLLDLEDSVQISSKTWAANLLSHLPNPSLLEAFSFHRHHTIPAGDLPAMLVFDSNSRGNDITAFIDKCTNLRTLSVAGEGLAPLKPAFYAAIRDKPITTLSFGLPLRGVTTTDLTKLIKEKKPPLERLLLDHIKDDKYEGVFPEWTRRFTPAGMAKLIKLGEKEGVDVDGYAAWAMNEDEGVPMAELIPQIPALKEQYRQFAINSQRMMAGLENDEDFF